MIIINKRLIVSECNSDRKRQGERQANNHSRLKTTVVGKIENTHGTSCSPFVNNNLPIIEEITAPLLQIEITPEDDTITNRTKGSENTMKRVMERKDAISAKETTISQMSAET
ncbi:hypothetical protein RclHR1_08870007 [Rhizophagus clarus]|uniref:Uncharacterized protein n=1 Tax=Rhizophagus clarus TaxID=94130 RepID=A0A2Z6Q800_9GLOM|nr:hypothetical protein RclHR1_12730004 [Rhizophagus clarus]GBC09442.1 hypothetical protein RclHR1_08870007 [Rhizophagus clarus]